MGVGWRERFVMCTRKAQYQPGRDDERHGQRDQHAHAGVDRDRAHIRSHQPADEGHWQQRGNHREGGEYGRAAHFVHRFRNDFRQRLMACQCAAAMDVLHHHDGIIDQNADGENQREQRHAIQRESIRPGGEQGRRQRQQHGDADHESLAPSHGKPHQRNHRSRGEQQLFDQLHRLVVCGFAIVARGADLHIGGDHAALQFIHSRQ